MGSRTRLLRFAPGVFTTAPFVHDHWEEVYLISGDLAVGNDEKGEGGEPFQAPTYACRPPGVFHGPFKSVRGCMLYEIHYYDEGKSRVMSASANADDPVIAVRFRKARDYWMLRLRGA